VRVEPDRKLRMGEPVTVQLPRAKLHFFQPESGERIEI
jgi:hypothetical protein